MLNAVDEKPGAFACAVDNARYVVEPPVGDRHVGEELDLGVAVAQREEDVRIKAARVDHA